MADIFKEMKDEERKSILDIFMEYRHYKLEEYLSQIAPMADDVNMEEVDEDDDCLTIDLSNSNSRRSIEKELTQEEE